MFQLKIFGTQKQLKLKSKKLVHTLNTYNSKHVKILSKLLYYYIS